MIDHKGSSLLLTVQLITFTNAIRLLTSSTSYLPDKMTEYEAGALSAWTPAQQAAINAERYQKQLNQDLIEAKREEEREARSRVKEALQRAREAGDEKAKARLKREIERLDKRYGPDQAQKHGRPVWNWADEETRVGALKLKEKEKKKEREKGYGQAVSLSAGQIVDNLVSRLDDPCHQYIDL